MSDEPAVDPQQSEVDLPETWREHVRELRSENARRRRENQELRAQLAALSQRASEAEGAQAAASEQAAREAGRLATVHRRLKELEVARLTRAALHEAATQGRTAEGGCATRQVDLSRAQRLLERVPSPVDLDADLVVDDEGQVALEAAAGERLRSFVAELVDLVSVSQSVAPPPVGGEPPRPSEPPAGPMPNSWDPACQASPAGKARASLQVAAATNAVVLDAMG